MNPSPEKVDIGQRILCVIAALHREPPDYGTGPARRHAAVRDVFSVKRRFSACMPPCVANAEELR
jgi:hypothetical protein